MRGGGPLTLRSVAWEGPDPAIGDVVRIEGDGMVAVVEHVGRGAGLGQFTLDCRVARLIEWRAG